MHSTTIAWDFEHLPRLTLEARPQYIAFCWSKKRIRRSPWHNPAAADIPVGSVEREEMILCVVASKINPTGDYMTNS